MKFEVIVTTLIVAAISFNLPQTDARQVPQPSGNVIYPVDKPIASTHVRSYDERGQLVPVYFRFDTIRRGKDGTCREHLMHEQNMLETSTVPCEPAPGKSGTTALLEERAVYQRVHASGNTRTYVQVRVRSTRSGVCYLISYPEETGEVLLHFSRACSEDWVLNP